jgi:hypothetical protein
VAEWSPVTEVADLTLLDEREIVAGFQLGVSGEPEPGSWASRALWHGWRNGRVAAGLAESDPAQDVLSYRWRQLLAYSDDHGVPLH